MIAQQREMTAQQREVAAQLSALPEHIKTALATDDALTSAVTDADYEEGVRNAFLPTELLRRCGLEIVRDVDIERSAFLDRQWDFRAPVTVTRAEPHPNAEGDKFVVFPSRTAYLRPPSVAARHVTPTKFSGDAAPLAHYLAIFEITTARKWTLSHGEERTGMLERLETRLRLSLARACADAGSSVVGITDLVAVVGVVAPTPYSQSVRDRMAMAAAPVLLKEMMNAGRFVFLAAPRAPQAAQ